MGGSFPPRAAMLVGAPAIAALVQLGAGCANGGLIDADAGDDDAGADRWTKDATFLDAPSADTAAPDTQPPDAGCPSVDAGLGGIGLLPGTTASATSSYQSSTPDQAIDGDPGTYWNAGGFSGSITITFPNAVTLAGVRFITVASPNATETYDVHGYSGGNPTMIGTGTLNVPAGPSLAAPISVTQGAYDAIRIDVSSQGSWVAIAEVSLLTPQCP